MMDDNIKINVDRKPDTELHRLRIERDNEKARVECLSRELYSARKTLNAHMGENLLRAAQRVVQERDGMRQVAAERRGELDDIRAAIPVFAAPDETLVEAVERIVSKEAEETATRKLKEATTPLMAEAVQLNLWDWLAGQALAAMRVDRDAECFNPVVVAGAAYDIADAMIAESEMRKPK
jgi:hypothetical protein